MNALKTSVVFIIFNRPLTTQKVFDVIRENKPSKLFVIADGPRKNRNDDEINCKKTREIIDCVDWECEVFKNYSDVNLGCGKRVSSGLDWVFENCEEAIILEDDCIPSQAFFTFCRELLVRYKYDTRIMHINGSNFSMEFSKERGDYFFSKYNHVWGWATWKRAWKLYDFNMRNWTFFTKRENARLLYDTEMERKYWTYFFNLLNRQQVKTTWDYQWTFTIWSQNGLCITPQKNLVKNIGVDGTHMNSSNNNPHLFREVFDNYLIREHPRCVIRSKDYDQFHFKSHFYKSTLQRIKIKIMNNQGRKFI